jgi:hypothetical protein
MVTPVTSSFPNRRYLDLPEPGGTQSEALKAEGSAGVISGAGLLKALLVSFVLAVSAYAVAKLNLFGLENTSDRLADQVYQRVTAADYGPDRRGQRAIRVIYLDESSLENMKGYGWTRFPPTYDQQWMMLDDLLNVGGAPPSAMYVDFVYMGQGGQAEGVDTFMSGVAAATRADLWKDNPGCTHDPLMKLACIVAVGGTPMIFARPSPAELEVFTETQRRLDEIAVLTPAVVGQQAYPMVSRYPQFDAKEAARRGVHDFDISPALALYTVRCLRQANRCNMTAFQALSDGALKVLAERRAVAPPLERTFDQPLDVVWGSRPDPDYVAITKSISGKAPPCRGEARDWGGRLMEQMVGIRGAGSGALQECLYTLNIGYDRLVSGQGLQQQDLTTILAGKLVLVGGHFRASNDWVESPVHGQVPGVHIHAMALDNLVEAGRGYRRNANTFLDSDLLKSVLIFLLAFSGVFGVMVRNSLLDRAVDRGMEPKLRAAVYGPLYLLMFGVSIAVLGFATWVGVAWFHRSPINWIGLLSVAFGFLLFATRQTLPADLLGSIEHLWLIRRARALLRLWRQAMTFEEERLVRPKPRAAASPPPAPAAPPVTPPPTESNQRLETPAHAES